MNACKQMLSVHPEQKHCIAVFKWIFLGLLPMDLLKIKTHFKCSPNEPKYNLKAHHQ